MKRIIFIAVLLSFLTGCVETQPIKSPCNWSGSSCWSRTKINQWNN